MQKYLLLKCFLDQFYSDCLHLERFQIYLKIKSLLILWIVKVFFSDTGVKCQNGSLVNKSFGRYVVSSWIQSNIHFPLNVTFLSVVISYQIINIFFSTKVKLKYFIHFPITVSTNNFHISTRSNIDLGFYRDKKRCLVWHECSAFKTSLGWIAFWT